MSSTETQAAEGTGRKSLLGGLRNQVQQLFALLGLVAIFAVFAIAKPTVFPTYDNIT